MHKQSIEQWLSAPQPKTLCVSNPNGRNGTIYFGCGVAHWDMCEDDNHFLLESSSTNRHFRNVLWNQKREFSKMFRLNFFFRFVLIIYLWIQMGFKSLIEHRFEITSAFRWPFPFDQFQVEHKFELCQQLCVCAVFERKYTVAKSMIPSRTIKMHKFKLVWCYITCLNVRC